MEKAFGYPEGYYNASSIIADIKRICFLTSLTFTGR